MRGLGLHVDPVSVSQPEIGDVFFALQLELMLPLVCPDPKWPYHDDCHNKAGCLESIKKNPRPRSSTVYIYVYIYIYIFFGCWE